MLEQFALGAFSVLCINRHQPGTVPRMQQDRRLPTYRGEVSHDRTGGLGRVNRGHNHPFAPALGGRTYN